MSKSNRTVSVPLELDAVMLWYLGFLERAEGKKEERGIPAQQGRWGLLRECERSLFLHPII